MTYRDDEDALLARNDALEQENERLRRERDSLAEKLAAKDAPPAPVPAAPSPPAPAPRRRRRLRRPWWIIALALPLLVFYLFGVSVLLATFAAGHDPVGVPGWVWFPGCMFALVAFGWGMPSRSARHSHTDLAPRWVYGVLIAHLVLVAVVLVLAGTVRSVGAAYYLPAIATAFLALGNLLAWYGEWEG